MGLGGGTVSNCLGTLQTLVTTRTERRLREVRFYDFTPPPPPPAGRPVHAHLGIKSSPVGSLADLVRLGHELVRAHSCDRCAHALLPKDAFHCERDSHHAPSKKLRAGKACKGGLACLLLIARSMMRLAGGAKRGSSCRCDSLAAWAAVSAEKAARATAAPLILGTFSSRAPTRFSRREH